MFGGRGKFLISGGNDACVKLWDWSRHFCAEQTSCNNDLILNIDVKKKVISKLHFHIFFISCLYKFAYFVGFKRGNDLF